MSDSASVDTTNTSASRRRHHRRSLSGWLKRIASSAPSPTSRRIAPIPKGFRHSKGVFGVPICESICYARATVGYVDESAVKHRKAGIIPLIVAKCGAFLKEHGLHTVGIFRLSGNVRRINALQVIFNDPRESYGLNFNWLGYTCHDAATILRRYLNKLPEPVIPHSFYQAFRDVMSDKYYHTNEERVRAFQQLIIKLPIPHQHLLLYLLDMLSLFSSNACDTRMDSANLAAVFAPGILSHPGQNTAIQYRISQRVLEFLIEFQALFTMQLLSQQFHTTTASTQSSTPPVPPLPDWLNQQQQQPAAAATTTITPRSSKSDPLVQTPESLTSPYATNSQERTDSGTDVRSPYIIKNTDDDDEEEEEQYDGQATPRAGSPVPVIPSPSICSRSTPKQNDHPYLQKQQREKESSEQCRTEFSKNIWQHTRNHAGYYVLATMGIVIASVICYEVYQAIWGRCCFEPYIFFSCFAVYWTLLARGIAWPACIPETDQDNDLQREDEIEDGDETYQDEDDGLSLFDDISVVDHNTEEAMLRDMSCEWHSLFTRAWRDDVSQERKDAELLSTMSASSRFNEEMTFENEDDYNDDDDSSIVDIDSEDLKAVWLRFQQVQEDAQLAAKLQNQEAEAAARHQEKDSANNPFLNHNVTELSQTEQRRSLTKSKSSEEWKIRYYNSPPQHQK